MIIDNSRITRAGVVRQILAACDFPSTSSEKDWIIELKNTCLAQTQKQLATIATTDENLVQKHLISGIDRIIDIMASYAASFNQSADSEDSITVTPACFGKSRTNAEDRAKPFYRGRISSRDWSLLISSNENCIEFSLAPTSQLLNTNTQLLSPIIVVHLECRLTEALWTYQNREITLNDFNSLCKESFKLLIESIYSDADQIGESRFQNKEIIPNVEIAHDFDQVSSRTVDELLPSLKIMPTFSGKIKRSASNASVKCRQQELSAEPSIVQALASPEMCPSNSAESILGELSKATREFIGIPPPAVPEYEFKVLENAPSAAEITSPKELLNSKTKSPELQQLADFPNRIQLPAQAVDKSIISHSTAIKSRYERELLSFLEKLSKAAAPRADIEAACQRETEAKSVNPILKEGNSPMKETLCSVISDSLNELLNGEQEALDELISHGAQLFFDKSFIEVEDCVQKALSRKRSLDALSGVGRRWRELGDLDEFVRSCGLDLMTMAPDPTLSACNPDYRLRFATDMLMKVIIQIGARAFEACNFDQALKASKIAVKLQAFEKIINEICCEVEIVSTEKIESKLETMLLSKNADPVHC